jgi:hypothetical protein
MIKSKSLQIEDFKNAFTQITKEVDRYKILYNLSNKEIYELIEILYYRLKIENIKEIIG